MFRFRSTFNLVKQSNAVTAPVRSASTSLPTEFTITGFPKFPVGTKIGKNMVMGEYGPYSPKIRALQDLYQKDPKVPIYLKKGTSDLIVYRLMLALIAFQICVAGPFGMYTLCINPEPYKRLVGITKK